MCIKRVWLNIHEETVTIVGCTMITKSTHMFVQNHKAPVGYWGTGKVVWKQSCQNTIIIAWWNTLRWNVLYNENKHAAVMNNKKECLESAWNSLSILNHWVHVPLSEGAQWSLRSQRRNLRQSIWTSQIMCCLARKCFLLAQHDRHNP